MKRILFLLIAIVNCTCLWCQTICVDERFELTGVVFRLTGLNVFQQDSPREYLSEVDSKFYEYKNHELIQFVKKTIDSKESFPFNFICDLAADIEITRNGIVFTDKWITYYDDYKCFDSEEYWTKSETEEYLRLLNRFYEDTQFHKFFLTHKHYYETTENSFKEIVTQINREWFLNFFGKPFELENIWISPICGKHNFSLHRSDRNGRNYNNCIIGCSLTDSSGNTIFSESTLNVLIHEICHNYSNPICKKYKYDFKDICDTIEKYIGDILAENHYAGAENILYEGMNRVCEYTYYKEDTIYHGDSMLFNIYVDIEEMKGFIWLEEMLRYMDVFNENRSVYNTFEDFFPKLKYFMQTVAKNMKNYYLPKYLTKTPVVLATYPPNNSIVDTNLSEIVIYFSKPMCIHNCMLGVMNELNEDDISYPIDYSKDEMQWKDHFTHVTILKHNLQPHTQYGFFIECNAVDEKTRSCCKYYKLFFNTK